MSTKVWISFHPEIDIQVAGGGVSTSSKLVFPFKKKSSSYLSNSESPSNI